MGYTYPELSNNPSNATLVASIKAQYSGPADVPVTNAKSKRQDPQPTKKTLYLAEAKLPLYGLDDGAGGGSPYNLLVFLGNVSSHSAEWLDSEIFVGMVSTLGGRNMQSEQTTQSTVDLSLSVDKSIAAGKMTVAKVEEYLKSNLRWRLELVSPNALLINSKSLTKMVGRN